MRGRLLLKLMAAMVAVLLIGGIVSAAVIGLTTRNAFRSLVQESDVALSENMAPLFEEYYRRNGSWKDIEDILEEPGLMLLLGRRYGQGMMERGMGMRMRPGDEVDRKPAPLPARLLLRDREGDTLLYYPPTPIHGNGEAVDKAPAEKKSQEAGTELRVNGDVVGYLFVGSMIEPALGPIQQTFLVNVRRSIALSTLISLLFAVGFAALIFRNLVAPLQALTEATNMLSRGNYNIGLDTERRDEIGVLSRSFRDMALELQRADEWKRRVIADSAHELRTPVALLQGNLEMIRDGVYPADAQHIESLYEETLLLSRLVGELRTLADAETGSSSYEFANFSLERLMQHLVQSFRGESGAKNIRIRLETKSTPGNIYGDRRKLEQAFSNIISNALGYSPEGGDIRIELERQEEMLLIAVEDSGDGIPEEDREKVFERFYRTDKARNRATGGSGLGLAVAREIVEAHAGQIEAKSPKQLPGARIEVLLGADKGS